MLGTLLGLGAGLVNSALQIGQNAQDRADAAALQAKIWEREDSMLQRRAADAKLAGFSPLAALGATQGATQVVTPTQFTPASIGDAGANAIADEANAINKLKVDNDLMMFEKELGFKQGELQQDLEKFKTQLAQDKELFEKNLVSQENMAQSQRMWQSMENKLDRALQVKLENIRDNTKRKQIQKEYQALKDRINADFERLNAQQEWQTSENDKQRKWEGKQRAYDRAANIGTSIASLLKWF